MAWWQKVTQHAIHTNNQEILETLQSLWGAAFKKDGIDKRKLSNLAKKEKEKNMSYHS